MSSKNGKQKGPILDPSVVELLRRHKETRRVDEEVKRRLANVVDRLAKKFPDHINVIMYHLEGQSARMLALRESARRQERSEADETN